ncbi:MAG TPA: carboxypeptidase-like regulatory domain-containing protein [Candidatus Binatia bacterium]|nr:carboxypeptidase-like regulatory domain-containing protein [Candidatus Binatia bacterium]
MNKLLRHIFLYAFLAGSLTAQERFDSGPYKGFVREKPELSTVVLPRPFNVASVKGRIGYSGGEKLPGAFFEIRDKSGHVRSAITDESGAFALANVPQGTYDFKVTKNEFQSVIGKVIVSRRFWKTKAIHISIQLGT